MFWPHRPRAGYPSVPRWLFVLILIVGVVLVVAFLVAINDDPMSNYN
jgi:hypothetical protein